MRFGTRMLLFFNRFFPKPVHPFNLEEAGGITYSEWEYRGVGRMMDCYRGYRAAKDIFHDKTVLDVGCGAGGNSTAYAEFGAKHVYGIDIEPSYEEKSMAFAASKGVNNFTFRCCDAAETDFPDSFFDVIMLNNSMEHLPQPEKTLAELKRILKEDGLLYINFPPYFHPYGEHLSDLIGIPWVQCFFGEDSMVEAYKLLAKTKKDGDARVSFRVGKRPDGREYFAYINHMTIRRYRGIIEKSGLKEQYYREIPLRDGLSFLARGLTREAFVRMVVGVYRK